MVVKTVTTYDPPCRMPNGLQWFEDELYVMDQQTDQVYVMNDEGYTTRVMDTPTENGSGITVGGGFLWTASNGVTNFREYRPTDTHIGWIYQLDLKTGAFVNRWRTPDGGGIHGLEWDDGRLWVTAFNPKAIHICDPSDDMRVLETFEVPTERLHGLALDGDGIWCAHTSDQVIIKYDTESGVEQDRIVFGDDSPAPHGLTIKDGELWYSDAMMISGVGHDDPVREGPEIGRITR